MKTVHHTRTLDYCDGPLLFEALDAHGRRHIAMAVDDDWNYVVVGVAPSRLNGFLTGAVDLRTLFEECGADGWYLTQAANQRKALNLKPQTGSLARSGLLPDEGYWFVDQPLKDAVDTTRPAGPGFGTGRR